MAHLTAVEIGGGLSLVVAALAAKVAGVDGEFFTLVGVALGFLWGFGLGKSGS